MTLSIEPHEFDKVIDDTLHRHNFYREKHNVPLLRSNFKLNEVSQEWADKLAQTDIVSHRPKNAYGENIFTLKSLYDKATDVGIIAVDKWYSEISNFNFQGTNHDMASSSKSFHFTQVIWKDSKELGTGVSRSRRSGKVYIVCNYDPRGNYVFRFKENVLPSIGSSYTSYKNYK